MLYMCICGLRGITSRPQAVKSVVEKPRLLANRFHGGFVADAWLGAYAEHLPAKAATAPPEWAFESSRIAPEPWFAGELDSPMLRVVALKHAPFPFRRRNLYTHSVELPIHLRPGRPSKSTAEKRLANAERQRRFRARRKAAFDKLRTLLDQKLAQDRPSSPS